MTKSIYIASSQGRVGKSQVAIGLIESLAAEVKRIGVFRPIVPAAGDPVLDTLLGLPMITQDADHAVGVTYEELGNDPDAALQQIIARFGEIADDYDAVVIVGSDYGTVHAPSELRINAKVAANLNAPVVLVAAGDEHSPDEIVRSAELMLTEFTDAHTDVVAVIANRVDPQARDEVAQRLTALGVGPEEGLVTAAIPKHPLMGAPTVRQQFDALGADLWLGKESLLDRESLGVLVAGMTLPNLLDRLETDFSVVVPSDRTDLLPGLLMAQAAGTFPSMAALFLVGGYEIPPSIVTLLRGLKVELPIGMVTQGTFRTAEKLFDLTGTMTGSPRKLEVARRLFNQYVDDEALKAAIDLPRAQLRTPLMFEHQLMARARADQRTIVLPEAQDPRILESASILLARGVAKLVLLGDAAQIKRDAFELGVDVSAAEVVDPRDPTLIEEYAAKYAELRSHKGVTIEQAREVMADPSYVGTMMVHLGRADGMVSGAVNTTANTIRPSLEFIKTKPGVAIVSSSFLMCLPDRVVVYADCAVNPDPSAEQLADIAISSAATATAFDIEPRVAMLSYSTGTSGSGADVDKVREATDLVRSRDHELPVEGPIQFDAAVDPGVGLKKMPGSAVAGQASVFIFPDLNTGNNTYKAVQRTAGAVAIGPLMQGLNKPVNDLSRGATVDDIVNTVAITAIQAQADG